MLGQSLIVTLQVLSAAYAVLRRMLTRLLFRAEANEITKPCAEAPETPPFPLPSTRLHRVKHYDLS